MSVITIMTGRLGNNLFQYALGRIVAEHHGWALVCQPQSSPKASTFFGHRVDWGPMVMLSDVTEYFPNAPLQLPGRVIDEPVQRFEAPDVAPSGTWEGASVNLQSLLQDHTPRQIRLGGAFPIRYDELAPYRERVREWFRPRPVDIPMAIGPSDVVVSIRRGFDVGILGTTLSLAYYQRILDRMRDVSRVYVCGTCIDAQVRKGLQRYDPIYYDATPIEHFVFMTRFNRMVLSNSTFAWWAAYLSDAVEIYAPPMPRADLNMREPRYIEISDVEIAPFAPFTVTERGRASGGHDLDPEALELLQWMVDQDRPISLADLSGRYTSRALRSGMAELGLPVVPPEGAPPVKEIRLRRVCQNLIERGLVAQDVRYLEA